MLKCDQSTQCAREVTHIENTGWVYCETHGNARRVYGNRVRKLREYEINRLNRGETITY